MEVSEEIEGIPRQVIEELTDDDKSRVRDWWREVRYEYRGNQEMVNLAGNMFSACAGGGDGDWADAVGYVVFSLGKGWVEGVYQDKAVEMLAGWSMSMERIRQVGRYLPDEEMRVRVEEMLSGWVKKSA